jgi:WD40-like Beta Propeller Repeat
VPSFSPDGRYIYYLVRRQSNDAGYRLWRTDIQSGSSENVLGRSSVLEYDLSQDGLKSSSLRAPRRVTRRSGWRLSTAHPRRRGSPRATWRRLTLRTMRRVPSDPGKRELPVPDEQGRVRCSQGSAVRDQLDPGLVLGRTLGCRAAGDRGQLSRAHDGGPPIRVCDGSCRVQWGPGDRVLHVTLDLPSRESPGRELAIPPGPGGSPPSPATR